MILSDLLPNEDHRISSSDSCLKPSNLWFKQSISTSLLSSFDVRTLNEVLTTSHAVRNWLFYRLSSSLHHCITCHSLHEDMTIFVCFCPFCQNSQAIKKEGKWRFWSTKYTKQGHIKRRAIQHLNITFHCSQMDEIHVKMQLKVHPFSYSTWHSGKIILVQTKGFPNLHLFVWLVKKTHLFGYKSSSFCHF